MELDAMRSLDTRDGVPGKVCSRCGQWKSLVEYNKKLRFVHSRCKQCLSELHAAAPKKDKRGYYKAYNAANREKRKAYREANRERFREYLKQYYGERGRPTANRERHREANRRWAERNREEVRAAFRRWRRNNPDKALENDHRRRARLRAAKGKFTYEEWMALKRAYEHKCLACGQHEPEVKLVPDHVVPLARGGANDIDNIQPLCGTCNSRKGAKTVDFRDDRDWRVELG